MISVLFVLTSIYSLNAQFTFVWRPSNDASNPAIYQDEQIPCDNDDLVMESNKSSVLFIQNEFKIRSLVLPDNGEITFGQETTLGTAAKWQCVHPDTTRRVIPQSPAHNFYDIKNWQLFDRENKEIDRPRLHTEKVPGDQDIAIFRLNTSSTIRIDAPAILKALKFGNNFISSDQIYSYLLTLEGQRVFELAGDLASIIEIAHTPYLWPNGRAFSIKDIKIPLIGQRLSNTLPEQFNSICSRVECEDTSHICTNPIKPHGHCCEVCAAVATFKCVNSPTFWLVQHGLRILELMYPSHIGISKIRLDLESAFPVYQITVLTDHSKNYDEDQAYDVLNMALNLAINLYKNESVFMSDLSIDYSVQRSKIHFGRIFKNILIVLTFLVLVSGLVVFEYRHNPRLRLWFSGRIEQGEPLRVVFRRGTEIVQLLNLRRASNQPVEEEIESSEEIQPTFQTEFQNLAFGRDELENKDFEESQDEKNNDYLEI